ncbi:hypothetical protein [Profundibacter sp.]
MKSGPRVGRWLIYGILDPADKTLVYVGKTHKRREIRLQEHIERALEGAKTPVHIRIRLMLAAGYSPEVFVLVRVPPDGSWQHEERRQIKLWRTITDQELPIAHPPQTPKSIDVEIRKVELLNVRDGG